MKQTPEQLSGLPSHELLLKLDEIRENVIQLGYEMAEAEKTYKDLKELMPSFLATIQNKEDAETMTEKRSLALASEKYQEKLKEMNEAEYQATLKQVEYRGWMKSLEALTSISYVRNSELKLSR